MKKLLNLLYKVWCISTSLIRFAPHIIAYKTSKSKDIIDYEVDRWMECWGATPRTHLKGLLNLLAGYPEFRSLFYFRTGQSWLSIFAKGQTNLEFYTDSEHVGKGLMIWHGFSTVINAQSIGEDCQIWQNVTIGKSLSPNVKGETRPTIRNGVKISANSVVIGAIEIANNVTIGAGTVVPKSVLKEGAVVVGSSNRVIG